MNARPFRLSRIHRAVVYSVFAVLFASGFTGWLAKEAVEDAGGTVAWVETWNPRVMRIHLGAAMTFLVVLGTVLATHVRTAWSPGINRNSGVFLGGWFLMQGLTGYVLLGFGGNVLQGWNGKIHVTLGLLAPLVLGGHILWGKWRMRPRRSPQDSHAL